MTINLQINEALIQEALALGNQQTEHDVVEEAAARICATSQANKDAGFVWDNRLRL